MPRCVPSGNWWWRWSEGCLLARAACRASGIQPAFTCLYCQCQSLLLGLLGGWICCSFTVYPECSPTCLALTINLVMGTQSLSQPARPRRSQLVKGAVGKADLRAEARCVRKADFPPRITKIHLLGECLQEVVWHVRIAHSGGRLEFPPKPFWAVQLWQNNLSKSSSP